MEFIMKVSPAVAIKADCLAVGVFADGTLTPAARAVDAASKGAVRAAIKSGDASGKRGTTLLLRGLEHVAAPRILLVGLGAAADFSGKTFADAVRAAVRHAGESVRDLAIAALDWKVKGHDSAWQARIAVMAAREAVFRCDELKSRKEDDAHGPARVILAAAQADSAAAAGLQQGVAIANGMALTKRLGNLPGNICTPSFLGDQAKALAREFKLGIEVLDRRDIEKLKMGSFLSVTRGSHEEPRLIVLKYNGATHKGKGSGKGKEDKADKPDAKSDSGPIVLVGKGITFDSGGISLKPGAAMDEMKFDMCGAASVFGTMRAVAEMKLPINLIGVVPTCENMPSGLASKPGDIVTSMSGQTIEILNTDAEGRLILCDALSYVERFKPAAVVDIATLTGACVVALGDINSGLFSTDDELAADLGRAAKVALDPAWRLPVEDDYQDQLKTNFADMANIGAPGKAGAVIAACFLARFTKAYRWAHLDIAGTAWKSGAQKGATGRPVPLLTHFLMERAQAAA